ncbi:type II toxin-antitoxin system HipA family toxin [Pseudoroseomonas ludipueritiae]|uniref:type II toxin-antitoxin system HipA family toxin n=1 Tax=Pseudoroseomonas ludipueritiae TaxID=198093 RepID=UPI003461BCC7
MKAPVTGAGRRLRQLSVYLYDTYVGEVFQDEHGRAGYQYAPSYAASDRAVPVSLSMPVSDEIYGEDKVGPFLWGLLPENPIVLDRIAREHHVSPSNPIALLSIIGQECAGAVRFIDTGPGKATLTTGKIEWLSEEEVGALLAGLREERGSIGRRPNDAGQFSLGGAQSKTALHYDENGNRWGIPTGSIPTTHILKPPMDGLLGQVENEHFSLQLSRELDSPAAVSKVMQFAGNQAIVVERYDRVRLKTGNVVRIHQEDMCQALSVRPSFKYQREGGPGLRDVCAVIRAYSVGPEEDLVRLIRAVAFNFVILGTDAHAKNYSVVIGPGRPPFIRLAPLYDLNSYLPYQDNPRKTKLAMSIDGTYLAQRIMLRHWVAESIACEINPDATLAILRDLIVKAPDAAKLVADRCASDGLRTPVLPKLVDMIAERCAHLSRQYA